MKNISGIRITVAAFGMLAGVTGIIAGIFEMLQGNLTIDGFVISTIGSNYLMFNDFTYFAITVIPNFLLTGILAVLVSSIVLVWSIRFVDRKHGVTILLALSVTQMLVGGGWVIDLALITCILATRINKPLNWWRTHLPTTLSEWLSKLYPLIFLSYTIISTVMLGLTIFGVNDEILIGLLTPLAGIMFLPMLLMIFAGIAHDTRLTITFQ